MSLFGTAFSAWLMSINKQGADVQSQLLTPASAEGV